ncbi:MAG: hypothetical protein JWQ79_1221 [Mucilaginibacter sp.]|jgi:hypothetical protein|nr:hypothetical protein [Mucilaginibacter sp.]
MIFVLPGTIDRRIVAVMIAISSNPFFIYPQVINSYYTNQFTQCKY